MRRKLFWPFLPALFLFALSAFPQSAQPTDKLHDVTADGMSNLTETQVVALTGLQPGSQVGRNDLQNAADLLVRSGLFANVKYNFTSKTDGVDVAFHVVESPRLPVLYDNIPWFTVQELDDAIKTKLPFYTGTLPAEGEAVNLAADAVGELLTAHKISGAVDHQVIGAPEGTGDVQMFHVNGQSLTIANIEFSDPTLGADRAVVAHKNELVGKPFSRMAISVWLNEEVRPIFDKKGLLRAKLGPAEVRLTGNPDQKLPTQIPVFIPVQPGPVYHYVGAKFEGNSLLSTITLENNIAVKLSDVADTNALTASFDKIREEYGSRGFLDAKVDPAPVFDDSAHTVRYNVKIAEGSQYKMGAFVLTGISPTGESKIHETFPVKPGETFDKAKYETYLIDLQLHREKIFGGLPIHYDTVGHWLRNNPENGTVDVLLDFK